MTTQKSKGKKLKRIVLGEGRPSVNDYIWLTDNGHGFRARVPEKFENKRIRLIAEVLE